MGPGADADAKAVGLGPSRLELAETGPRELRKRRAGFIQRTVKVFKALQPCKRSEIVQQLRCRLLFEVKDTQRQPLPTLQPLRTYE